MIVLKLGHWCWLNEKKFDLGATDSGQVVVICSTKVWDSCTDWEKEQIIQKDLELARDFTLDNSFPAEKKLQRKL